MKLYIGWDVGGWNCARNPRARDALCVLRSENDGTRLIGEPWQGNLRNALNESRGSELMRAVLRCCRVEAEEPFKMTIAIDAPLGWPLAMLRLFDNGDTVAAPDDFRQNPYLFRETERFLAAHGFEPLSAVKDMIGSQATKAMHFLRAIGSQRSGVGVWKSSIEQGDLVAIETYPSACERSTMFRDVFSTVEQADDFQRHISERGEAYRQDVRDALRCAVIAYLYAENPACLKPPASRTSPEEGWIWVPEDALG